MAQMNENTSTQTEENVNIQEVLDTVLHFDTETRGSRKGLGSPEYEERDEVPAQPRVSALDVAEYILRKLGPMSTMKLQKLVYYCQAWSLVWDEVPLFEEAVEAWANGPVIRKLYNYHKGRFTIDKVCTGNPDLLKAHHKETIDAVVEFYGAKSGQWLIDLTHSERPWQEARRGLPEFERCSRHISHDSMADYYSSL